MFKKDIYYLLNKNIEKLNNTLTKNNFIDLVELLGSKKQILIRNLLSGISKGIGAGIGFYLLTAVLIFILQKIVKLNIPIIGQYIADLMDIAENYRR